MEIYLEQIRIAYVTKRILGRIQLFECAKFVIGLVQFDDLLFAFCPSFLGLYNLLSRRPFKEEKTVLPQNFSSIEGWFVSFFLNAFILVHVSSGSRTLEHRGAFNPAHRQLSEGEMGSSRMAS